MRKSVKNRNPKIGEHPDLFEKDEKGLPRMTAVWSGGEPAVDPHAQYAKDMSAARRRQLPRNAFDEATWAELDEDDQEYILEHDPESLARVKELVDAFVEREKYLTDPDEGTKQMWIESDSEYFSQWLSEQDEIVDNRSIRDAVWEVMEHLGGVGEGVSSERQDEVRGAINEALRDVDNYDFRISGNEYSAEGLFKERVSGAGGIYIESRELKQLVDPLFPDELEKAVEQIKHDTYLHVDTKMLTKDRDIEIDYEVDYYFVADPDWDKIETKARELLGEEGKPEVVTPPEERIVYKFKDGFYVVDLLSSELAAEGKTQGICVGKGQYGYTAAVKRGDTKIFSLRRPSGKPLFTIEAETSLVGMDDEGKKVFNVTEVRQIKGKANRLPGWDAGKDGQGVMKLDEVKKAVEFLNHLEINPWGVRDLRPALNKFSQEAGDGGLIPDAELKRLMPVPRQNPRHLPKLPPNERPLGFDSPWTP